SAFEEHAHVVATHVSVNDLAHLAIGQLHRSTDHERLLVGGGAGNGKPGRLAPQAIYPVFVGVVVQPAGYAGNRSRRRGRRGVARSGSRSRRRRAGTREGGELFRIADGTAIKHGTVHEYAEVATNLLHLSDLAHLAVSGLDGIAHLERGHVGISRCDGNTGRLAPGTIVPVTVGELVDQRGVTDAAWRFSYRLLHRGRRSGIDYGGNSAERFW